MNFKTARSHAMVTVLILFGLVLSGCNFPGLRATPDISATNAAQTVAASLAQTPGPGDGETPTEPPPPPTTAAPPPTTEVPPSDTPLPTFTPTSTHTAIPCDQVTFIKDVTIPDGEEIKVGTSFTKTWRLKNTGSCTWTSGYDLVFDHGDAMDGPASKQLTSGTVPPGQTVDVSVNLTAPGSAGTYKGFWKLRNGEGIVFGLGPSKDVAFWVEIKTVEPKVAFKLTFENIHACYGHPHYATVKVRNTGDFTFESGQIHIIDKDDGDKDLYGPFAFHSNPFQTNANDCPPANDELDPGDVAYISANLDANGAPASGHKIRVFVTLCTAEGGGGECEKEAVNFTAP